MKPKISDHSREEIISYTIERIKLLLDSHTNNIDFYEFTHIPYCMNPYLLIPLAMASFDKMAEIEHFNWESKMGLKCFIERNNKRYAVIECENRGVIVNTIYDMMNEISTIQVRWYCLDNKNER